MRNNKKDFLGAVGLFLFLSLVMTYPLLLNMGSGLRGRGDPLLNTWILSWNVEKLKTLDFKNLFHTNIFYPHQRTLAFSEVLFAQTILAFPVKFISGNPILAHNIVLLFAFWTSGLGMFFLARHLTKNSYGAVVAGIIYAYSPFMFAHLFQVQILSAGGIPLAFLFLHKFFEYQRTRNVLLFALFFILQALANGYYALYLSLFAGLFIFFFLLTDKKFKDWRFWQKFGLAALPMALILSPVFYNYQQFRKETGFSRDIGAEARLSSYFATAAINRIYGKLTAPYKKTEGELFPGIAAFLLACFGVGTLFPRKKDRKILLFYGSMAILSFLFTFGSKGPYIFLHKYIPGFNGLRVATRFHILFMFSLALFAAFGIENFFTCLKKGNLILKILIPFIILAEYFSAPVPLINLPVKENIPEVYRWLAANRNKDAVIVELPFPRPGQRVGEVESFRIYYSIYHWKKMINGYSGHIPPLYYELRKKWHDLPLEDNVRSFKDLRVRYMIFHSSFWDEKEFETIHHKLLSLNEDVEFVTQLGEAWVYKLR